MNIVIVARDAGPSHALKIVADALRNGGHSVTEFLAGGSHFPDDIKSQIEDALIEADRLLVGIASIADRANEEGYAFVRAKTWDIPVFVFSDIYGAYSRSWVADLVQNAHTLFVTNEYEVNEAAMFTGRETRIVVSGNPYFVSFFNHVADRDDVRKRLRATPEEKVVLIAGSKELERNILLFNDVVLATQEICSPLRLVFTMHPGANHSEDAQNAYKGITKWSKHSVVLVPKTGGISTQEALCGSDLVISGGASTISIMAACQRVPIIDLLHELDRLYLYELSKLNHWLPVTMGVSIGASDKESLKASLRQLLNDTTMEYRAQRTIQKDEFSPETFAKATQLMVEALTS